MKIKTTKEKYSVVKSLPKEAHIKPIKQKAGWRRLMKRLSKGELKAVDFSYKKINMKKLGADEPALFLMNHSSFTDLNIAATILADRQFHIVMTDDGMVGKAGLMQQIGCIPTKKFIQDTSLVKDMVYCVKNLNSSVLMYPEASYSFDGTATPLPDSLGKLAKLMGVPVVMIKTEGAFLRDPLYNNLQKRAVKVTATENLILTKEDIKEKSAAEISQIIDKEFDFDNFRDQVRNNVLVTEDFRADNLERVLYKCPSCKTEGQMTGKGIKISCGSCGKTYSLLESGLLEAEESAGERITEFEYISDWYGWERACVKKELEEKRYSLDCKVDILMLVNTKTMYEVGEGRLRHDNDGFMLTGCDGELEFALKPKQSYSLYADYYWYEIGDMICIGDNNARYYCFPKAEEKVSVAKARLATEELYKLSKNK